MNKIQHLNETIHLKYKLSYQYMLWEDTTMQRRTIYLQPNIIVKQQEVNVKILGKGNVINYGKVHVQPTKSGSRKHSEFTDALCIQFEDKQVKWVHYKTVNKQLEELITVTKHIPKEEINHSSLSVFKQSTEIYSIELQPNEMK